MGASLAGGLGGWSRGWARLSWGLGGAEVEEGWGGKAMEEEDRMASPPEGGVLGGLLKVGGPSLSILRTVGERRCRFL